MIRLVDFIAAFIGIVLLSPFILLIAIILFLEHRKPFFIQKRVGKNMVAFTLIKFRSMSPKAANLPTQEELINERQALGVFKLRPGITGPAQVKNIDMSTPKKLALEDSQMVGNLTLLSYLKYVLMTVTGSGQGDKVRT